MNYITHYTEEERPVYDKAFRMGYGAFKRGIIKCMYVPETMEHKEWHRGFDRAYFDNISRLNKGAS